MVSRFLKLLSRDVATMNQAAFVLGAFSICSQILGLLRDRFLASFVGPGSSLDTYYAAFRIPDFLYTAIASLFSVTVLIPFITEALKDTDTERGALKRFSDSVFTVYSGGMIVVCVAAYILMPYLTRITAPGFDSVMRADLIQFARIMLLSPFLMGLSGLFGSFAQVQKKFFSFAIAPLFYNAGILIGILVLRPLWGMAGVVWGVVLGALFHLLIQIPALVSLQKIPSLTRRIDWAMIRNVVKLSLPRTFALSLTNITFIMMSAAASLLAVGSISVFQFSYNIETTPLMIIGISYAVAAFPTLTKLFADGDRQGFLDIMHRATRNIFFFSIPVAFLFIVLRAQIVRVLLGAGEFSWNDTRLVAASLALFALSITAQCMVLLLVRGFYAMGNTKTPLKINALSLVITGISAAGLIYAYNTFPMLRDFVASLLRIQNATGTSVILLSLAFSIGQTINACLLWRYFHKRIKENAPGALERKHALGKTLFHTLSAGILAAAVAYGMLLILSDGVDQGQFWGILTQGVIAGLVGLIMYAIVLRALRNEDIMLFYHTLKSKFWKQKPLTPEQPDLS